MLSILIPTYNYNVLSLVQELHKQAKLANIAFEIIVLDDASPDQQCIYNNKSINTLSNCCRYEYLQKNIGRSAIRNLLAKKAKYNWLLYLDSDTIPVNGNLIANYIPFLNDEEKVVYGGIRYQTEKPAADKLLRWVYGNKREALSKDVRAKSPHISLLTLNFAIKKSVFEKVSFNESIPNLRHEDTLFSYNLSQSKIKVQHIYNPVYHLGLDTSEIFIKKSEEAVIGLKYLLDHNLLSPNYVRIAKIYDTLKALGLRFITAYLINSMRNRFRRNLLSANPSMFIFDLYRLGYICSLK